MNSLTISNINPQQAGLDSWVNLIAEHAKPDNVVWCDGSKREYDDMIELLVKQGTLTNSILNYARIHTWPALILAMSLE